MRQESFFERETKTKFSLEFQMQMCQHFLQEAYSNFFLCFTLIIFTVLSVGIRQEGGPGSKIRFPLFFHSQIFHFRWNHYFLQKEDIFSCTLDIVKVQTYFQIYRIFNTTKTRQSIQWTPVYTINWNLMKTKVIGTKNSLIGT